MYSYHLPLTAALFEVVELVVGVTMLLVSAASLWNNARLRTISFENSRTP